MSDRPKLHVISPQGMHVNDHTIELYDTIMEAVYAKAGIIPVAAAVGVLELAKSDLIFHQRDTID